MANRKKLNEATQFEVVYRSARRCCMCFALARDFDQKAGQLAHLDQDRSNDAQTNLAWLCLPHHDEYDSRTSQSKGYTEAEVKRYRDLLYAEVDRWRQSQPHVESPELFRFKQKLLESNTGLFFFAAYAGRHPMARKRLLDEVTDSDFKAQLADAWAFIDSQSASVPLLTREQLMAQYIGTTEDGSKDLMILLGLSAQAISAMSEEHRNKALFALQSDTIRSALMLLHKIRTDRASSHKDGF